MYHGHLPRPLLHLLLILLLSLSACFSGSASTTSEVNPDNASPAQQAADSPASAPTNTPVPTAADPATDNTEPTQITVIEDVSAINSYRMRIEIHSEAARGDNNVAIEGEFVKEPPAERLVIRFEENGNPEQMEMVVAGGQRYFQAKGMWMQAPDMALNIAEYTLITPADIAEKSTGLTRLDSETVNGRATVHYQGDKSSIPAAGTPSDTFDVSQVDSAQLDLWVDEAENFIVKLQINVEDGQGEQAQRHTLLIEYLDFNAPISIEAPETLAEESSTGASGEQPVAVTEPRTDLGKLLGFDLLLPTGSQVTLQANNMVQATTPYTLDESVNLFQQNMPNNGYTLMSQVAPVAGQTVLMYQQGAKIITINLTALAANETRIEVIAAP
jgi:hypothetical protein